jgi:hypothetical protein
MMSKNLFGVSEARGTTPITRTELFSSDQHAVADLDVDGNELAALVAAAGSNGEHLALCGFSRAVSGMIMPPVVDPFVG